MDTKSVINFSVSCGFVFCTTRPLSDFSYVPIIPKDQMMCLKTGRVRFS
jgi:hypothetical protein